MESAGVFWHECGLQIQSVSHPANAPPHYENPLSLSRLAIVACSSERIDHVTKPLDLTSIHFTIFPFLYLFLFSYPYIIIRSNRALIQIFASFSWRNQLVVFSSCSLMFKSHFLLLRKKKKNKKEERAQCVRDRYVSCKVAGCETRNPSRINYWSITVSSIYINNLRYKMLNNCMLVLYYYLCIITTK